MLESSAWLPGPRAQKWRSKWLPDILNEHDFPVHDTSWDELIAKCNSPSFKERNLWRGVLSTDGTENFKERLRADIEAGRTPVNYFWGGQGVGKSFGALPIEIMAYEIFLDLGIETRLGVWSADYPATVTRVSEAERLDRKYHIHQDEDPDATGAGAIEARRALFADINQLRINRISLYIIDPVFNPEFLGRMLYGFEVIGRNDTTGATLYVVYTKNKYPLYYMNLVQRLDYQWLYESYNAFKEIHSHEIAKHGGAVSATNIVDVQNKADEIYAQLQATYPDLEKITEAHIYKAASIAGVTLSTTKGKVKPILLTVKELFLKDHSKPTSKRVAPTQQNRTAVASKASEYSKRGHDEENRLWNEYLPALFRGTGAKVIYRGQRGQKDGIIRWDGITYICNSKDYKVPLNEHKDWIEYSKLKPEFDQFDEELQRGDAKKVILAIMYHEANRNLWFVSHVPDPGQIERGSQGRPKGSLPIAL